MSRSLSYRFAIEMVDRNVYQLLSKYGLTVEEFKALYFKQKGSCAICGERLSPACVDHDHETGAIRGLLCRHCNSGLGYFKDQPRLLARALVYLEENGKEY